jgi:hypothetical protein
MALLWMLPVLYVSVASFIFCLVKLEGITTSFRPGFGGRGDRCEEQMKPGPGRCGTGAGSQVQCCLRRASMAAQSPGAGEGPMGSWLVANCRNDCEKQLA